MQKWLLLLWEMVRICFVSQAGMVQWECIVKNQGQDRNTQLGEGRAANATYQQYHF